MREEADSTVRKADTPVRTSASKADKSVRLTHAADFGSAKNCAPAAKPRSGRSFDKTITARILAFMLELRDCRSERHSQQAQP